MDFYGRRGDGRTRGRADGSPDKGKGLRGGAARLFGAPNGPLSGKANADDLCPAPREPSWRGGASASDTMNELVAATAAMAMAVDDEEEVAACSAAEPVTVETPKMDAVPMDAHMDAEAGKENERPVGAHRSGVGDAETDPGQPFSQTENDNNQSQSSSNHSPAVGGRAAGPRLREAAHGRALPRGRHGAGSQAAAARSR